MNYENSVTISGLLHHLSRKKDDKHFAFSIRHENLWTDGTTRRDFLNARAFNSEVQETLKNLEYKWGIQDCVEDYDFLEATFNVIFSFLVSRITSFK